MGRPVWKTTRIDKHEEVARQQRDEGAHLLLERIHAFRVLLCELLDGLRVSRIGPDDNVVKRLAGLLVPDYGGLSGDRTRLCQLTLNGKHRERRAAARTVDS